MIEDNKMVREMSELTKVTGKVLEINPLKSAKGNDYFTFKVEGEEKTFSEFGSPVFQIGDEITFKYETTEKNGKTYYNMKYLYTVGETEEHEIERHGKGMEHMDDSKPKEKVMLAAAMICSARGRHDLNEMTDEKLWEMYDKIIKFLGERDG